MRGANVFIGVSVAECITPEDVLSMDSYPAVFAMANPDPEILPEAVEAAMGTKPYIMATGRSDYPNQINNVLGFPFLFRGALDVKARTINMAMKVAAANALAAVAREPVADYVRDLFSSVAQNLEFGRNCVIPKPFDRRLYVDVSFAVAEAAVESGAAPTVDLEAYRRDLEQSNQQRIIPERPAPSTENGHPTA
jgi:malate dehydrogenase (oxaloacetate-decarboxylating)(NADP+)